MHCLFWIGGLNGPLSVSSADDFFLVFDFEVLAWVNLKLFAEKDFLQLLTTWTNKSIEFFSFDWTYDKAVQNLSSVIWLIKAE